jgi:hypothetical protein
MDCLDKKRKGNLGVLFAFGLTFPRATLFYARGLVVHLPEYGIKAVVE